MRARSIALAVGVTVAFSGATLAQPYNGIADCEKHAKAFFGRDADFKSFIIDPKTVNEIAFDDKVGSQYVAAIWRGRAAYTTRSGKFTRTFICLHGGGDKGALFIHMLPR
jgi:hypothetical protein